MGPERVVIVFLFIGYFPMAATIKALFTLYQQSTEKRIEEQKATMTVLNDLTRVVERIADVVEVKMK